MVPGARIELATPAFSGRRSTNELPRQFSSFLILGALASSVNSRRLTDLQGGPRIHQEFEKRRSEAAKLHF